MNEPAIWTFHAMIWLPAQLDGWGGTFASDINIGLGTRMTGAGFSGCAVAHVRDEATNFVTEITARYPAVNRSELQVYITEAAAGASADRIGDQAK